MQIKPSTIIWALIFVVLIGFLYLVNDILMPFVFGGIVAYFLDPAVDKVEGFGPSRTVSTILVLAVFALVFGLTIFLLGPLFLEQFKNLAANVPVILSEVEEKQGTKIASWLDGFAPELQEKIKDFFYRFSVQIVQGATIVVRSIVTSGGAILNFLSLLIISPIIAFYLLRDYDVIVKKVDNLLPRGNLTTIRNEFFKIDETVSAYIRGQLTVCAAMAVFYSLSLNIIDLNYALAIGVITGVLTFIPYAGMAIGMIFGLAIAYFQFGISEGLLYTLVVFIVGNFLEGTFITPYLVGNKVRLHPAWIIFALLAGGAVMGFTGVLIAIPVAAILGVLVRSALDRYKNSALYLGYPIMQIEKQDSSRFDLDIMSEEEKKAFSKEKTEEHVKGKKRGRGRPPKAPESNNSDNAQNSSSPVPPSGRRPISDAAPKKRGRGRPRKSDK